MNLKMIQASAERLVKDNATTILTAGGVAGTVTTGALAWRGGMKYLEIVRAREVEELRGLSDSQVAEYEGPSKTTKLSLAAQHVAPPIITGGLTIGAIVVSHRMSAQKAAALAAAYGLSQNQFDEYRQKVAEKLGVNKTEKFNAERAQDRVDRTSGSTQVVVMGDNVLCFDLPTGRYFESSMEKIRQAVNMANEEILHHEFVSANYFYEEIGLETTTWGDEVGFNQGNLIELEFSHALKDGKPVLTIDFKRLPLANYDRPGWKHD